MQITSLSLKPQWFQEVVSGRKKVEYRSLVGNVGDYYVAKFLNVDSYKGKTTQEIRMGLLDGSIKSLHEAGVTHIRFHNAGSTCLVEVKGLRIDTKHRMLCIDLGKVLTGRAASNVAG